MTLTPLLARVWHTSHEAFVEELCLVYAHDLHVAGHVENLRGRRNRCGPYLVKVMGDDLHIGISSVDCRLENGYLLVGEPRPAQAAYELLRLAGEH